ncbi:hypothetical protein K502DRAFT_324786 [Neoconidiobolus thromboides FSU 785]|nr:hypothetical protein K502DRAFT_324786 [Neoconidiobolus thromboides FSU 785]
MQNTGKKTINNQPINRERVGPKIEKSPAEKRILEQERSRVVDMYRRLKKEKLEQQQ